MSHAVPYVHLHELQPPQPQYMYDAYIHHAPVGATHYQLHQQPNDHSPGYNHHPGQNISVIYQENPSKYTANAYVAPNVGMSQYDLCPMSPTRISSQGETSGVYMLKHGSRKRKAHSYASDNGSLSRYEVSSVAGSSVSDTSKPHSSYGGKKRKTSSYNGSTYEEESNDETRSTSTLSEKRQNHSQIEKRRRDKMNMYISELSKLVPMCRAMARKLDKLTVLRLAVQYLRSIKGASTACPITARPRPAFISQHEMNELILQTAKNSFLFVIGCNRGRLLYVSSSITNMLQYEPNELLGQSVFDIIHPKDITKLKEQLSSTDINPRERLIDAKTMLPIKSDVVTDATHFGPGVRRSFFCRIKCKHTPGTETITTATKQRGANYCKTRKKQGERKYVVVHCTGYLKSWAMPEMYETNSNADSAEGIDEAELCNLSCLVAVGRNLCDLTTPLTQNLNVASTSSSGSLTGTPKTSLCFISRHGTDGKFLFVDQRVTLAVGFLPQELLGTSLYEYMNAQEIPGLARAHKTALAQRVSHVSMPYSFQKKDGSFVLIQTHFKPFKNPWTKDTESMVANNMVLTSDEDIETTKLPFIMFDESIQNLLNPQEIDNDANSEEILQTSAAGASPELLPEFQHDNVFTYQNSFDAVLTDEDTSYKTVRNNVPLSSVGVDSFTDEGSLAFEQDTTRPAPISPSVASGNVDGNGEAAMAVVMNLLEADAGFGGTVDFSAAPWLFREGT